MINDDLYFSSVLKKSPTVFKASSHDSSRTSPKKKTKTSFMIKKFPQASETSTVKKRKKKTSLPHQLCSLARDFIGYRISAAGVSYVITSKSRFRRWLWCLAVIGTIGFMGYMTVNVILEYLSYPKMVLKEATIHTKLEFPAVTVCALNPILNHVTKTSIYKLKKLRDMLENSQVLPSRRSVKTLCYSNPMCRWSWFNESCSCASSPCTTEFCLPDLPSTCICSFIFCTTNDSLLSNACNNSTMNGHNMCTCDTNFNYPKDGLLHSDRNGVTDLNEVLEMIRDPEVRKVIRLIRMSKVDDLMDIEDGLMPSLNDLYHFGTDFDSLVIACSYEGSRCDRENFTILYHAKYGKCYMFNFMGKPINPDDRPLDVYNYGSISGLQLLLHIGNQKAVDLLSREVGVRVVVHDPNDLPFVAEFGINIRPHDMTAVEITMSRTNRLQPPWGRCRKSTSFLGFDYQYKPYSLLGCEKACRDYFLLKYCHCTKRQFQRGTVLLSHLSDIPFCSVANLTQLQCLEQVVEAVENKTISCGCFPPCREKLYSTSVSSSKLNEDFYETVKAVKTLVNVSNRLSYIEARDRRDMVGLKVYYNTFQVTTDKEIAYYSWETLVANIGGNLGFFMGLSLVTFLEMAEFLWDVIISFFNLPFQRRTKVHRFHPFSCDWVARDVVVNKILLSVYHVVPPGEEVPSEDLSLHQNI